MIEDAEGNFSPGLDPFERLDALEQVSNFNVGVTIVRVPNIRAFADSSVAASLLFRVPFSCDRADADQVIVLIADDGVGFDVQQVKAAGRGLENMKRRAAQIDGRIEIESGRGATVVRIVLPVHR